LALVEKRADSTEQQRAKGTPVVPLPALEQHRHVEAVRIRRERIAAAKERRATEAADG
jgi:hypothetical protein